MKALSLAAVFAGLALTAGLVGYVGAGAIVRSLLAIGAGGFAVVCIIQLLLTVVAGIAWRALLPGVASGKVIWARLVRDSTAEALPLSQVVGYVLGARALALTGVSATLATASTIVDVTLEFLAQLPFTGLGLALFVWLQPETEIAAPVLLGLALATVAAAAFLMVQRRGFRYFDRIAAPLGAGWAERGAAGAAALHGALAQIYRRQTRLWASFTLHFVSWIATASQLWLALWLAGAPLSFAAVLAIESLLFAIRTAAFAVPQAVGVQEGAYILLGAGFGLTPEMALALSFLKRGRDFAVGLPVVAIWQACEGRHWWRRRAKGSAARAGAAAAHGADVPQPSRD